VCKIEEYALTLTDMSCVINYFNHHLGADGLATLSIKQKRIYGKSIALQKPVVERWSSQVDAARSLLESEAALVETVKHARG
jgi:hypothetical protein